MPKGVWVQVPPALQTLIDKPLTIDGILVTENSEGEKYCFKILNLENKPSLYRGGLAL